MNQRNTLSFPACGQILCVSLLLLGWAAAGCSRGLQRPIVHPVEGLVTLDGQPIEGVGVSFSPIVPGKGAAAFGKTLSDGSFSLTSTHGGLANAGAMAGEYAVMFQKFIDVAPDAVPPRTAAAADDPTRRVPQWFSRQEASRLEDEETVRFVILGLLPEAYAKAATSGFRATVAPGRNAGEAFTFRLSSDYQADADR
jgi:hypothetical protein